MNATHTPEPAASATLRPLIELRAVSKRFGTTPDLAMRLAQRLGAAGPLPLVQAVDGVTLAIARSEVLGLVGESGCGKSTLGRIAVGLHAASSGARYWYGELPGATNTGTEPRPIDALPADLRRAVALKMQMVFQDASASLNPRLTVGTAISEAPLAHRLISAGERAAWLAELMQKVGLDPSYAGRYPHQFSGGQRARIGIARALAVRPEFIVCDEAVAALDVSIQAQIINLFMQLRSDFGLTYLFISHDLGVVRHVSDRVAIMYLGRIVEIATTEAVFTRPHHPYTQALVAELPKIDAHRRAYQPIAGELPSPLHPPVGCHFHPRCPHAQTRCRAEPPPALREVAPGHWSACVLDQLFC